MASWACASTRRRRRLRHDAIGLRRKLQAQVHEQLTSTSMQLGRAGFVPALFFVGARYRIARGGCKLAQAALREPSARFSRRPAGRSASPDARIGFPLYKTRRFWAIIRIVFARPRADASIWVDEGAHYDEVIDSIAAGRPGRRACALRLGSGIRAVGNHHHDQRSRLRAVDARRDAAQPHADLRRGRRRARRPGLHDLGATTGVVGTPVPLTARCTPEATSFTWPTGTRRRPERA